MMQSAEDRQCGDPANSLNRTTDRRILGQRQVGPDIIVISGVRRKDSAQMSLAKDDDVIEAFAADRAD